VLLTNLANRIQPLIRYDLGDGVTVAVDSCPCGSHFPTIAVEGRCDDALRLPGRRGGEVTIVPLALETILEETAGAHEFQVVQRRDGTLAIRLGTQERERSRQVRQALRSFFETCEIGPVESCCHAGAEARRASGKLRGSSPVAALISAGLPSAVPAFGRMTGMATSHTRVMRRSGGSSPCWRAGACARRRLLHPGYYAQSIHGHFAMLDAARPIPEVIADPTSAATLRSGWNARSRCVYATSELVCRTTAVTRAMPTLNAPMSRGTCLRRPSFRSS
jgi:hypothetical protein